MLSTQLQSLAVLTHREVASASPFASSHPSRLRAAFTFLSSLAVAACFCFGTAAGTVTAQAQESSAPAEASLGTASPLTTVRWAGSLPEAAGRTVELRFELYQNASGGSALWSETQSVAVGTDGKYTVLLGSAHSEGLPAGVFQGGEPRWIAVVVVGSEGEQGAEQQPARTLLASVPYAMKSADAATLEGRGASEFVTQEQLREALKSPGSPAQPAVVPMTGSTVTGTGTDNYIPLWTGAATQGTSVIQQVGSNIAIDLPADVTPTTSFSVYGTFSATADMRLSNGTIATASAPRSSPLGEFISSSYSSSLAAAVAQSFAWQSVGESNNTATPTGNLELLYGSGSSYLSPTPTGFSFNANGTANFASGQSFTALAATPATASTGYSSPSMKWQSNAYSSTTSASVPQSFLLRAVPSGNDTASPTGNLELFTGSGSAASNPTFTGLSIAPTGIITFASGQTFPGAGGAGAITGVTPGTGLTGGGTTGAVTLAIDPTVVPELSAANTFTNSQTITGLLTAGGVSTGTLDATDVTSLGSDLNVGGNATVSGQLSGTYAVAANAKNTATASTGYGSILQSFASVYNSGTAAAVNPWLGWNAVPLNNNTASPSLELNFVYGPGDGTHSNTGLSLAPTGIITFASGQTFPGTGTITGITTTSPLAGSGTSGSVALSLNTSALETTLNGVYPQLGASVNDFTGSAVFTGKITASSSGASTAAVTGNGTSGAVGVYGNSDSATGVYGLSNTGNAGYFTNSSVADAAIFAVNSGSGSSGNDPVALEASTNGDYAYSVYASATGVETRGVYADAAGNGGVGVFGESDGQLNGSNAPIGVKGLAKGNDGNGMVADETGTGGYGVYAHASGVFDSTRGFAAGVYALGDNGYGVLGLDGGASTTGSTTASSLGAAGVWGDTNVPYTSSAYTSLAGVAGTADNNYGGYFSNNSSSSLAATVYTFNESTTSGALVFQAQGNIGGSGHTCTIDGAANLSCSGTVSAVVKAADGVHSVETYAMQSPENWMEDFGTGTMERGVAVVKIDPAFAGTISGAADYHVFLTPRGDSNGLYVINTTPTSFEVRESKGGTSSLSFDYRIVAKRRGFESLRLADVTERTNALEAQHQQRMERMKAAPAPRTIVEPEMAPARPRREEIQRPKVERQINLPQAAPARGPISVAEPVKQPVSKTAQ